MNYNLDGTGWQITQRWHAALDAAGVSLTTGAAGVALEVARADLDAVTTRALSGGRAPVHYLDAPLRPVDAPAGHVRVVAR